MKAVKEIREYSSLFKILKKLDKATSIAIDGRCGSGKTSLAEMLKQEFDMNVFHMDDFFLPFEMKTKERLSESGGNVHYELFKRKYSLHYFKEKKLFINHSIAG
ncbi:P-loop NTPase fold protein [Oceanobacillus sp. FSL W7-1309]|uniref:P-loop NTPase fold protein n=1 Tax=Oceanobacillus sp. FSL W7-1309 TaxID=2954539 RepID=UPI0030F8BEAC